MINWVLNVKNVLSLKNAAMQVVNISKTATQQNRSRLVSVTKSKVSFPPKIRILLMNHVVVEQLQHQSALW